jgi:hypothetical protein
VSREITKHDVFDLQMALHNLRIARDRAKSAGAKQTLAKIRLAITSCGGAIRHAEGHANRTKPGLSCTCGLAYGKQTAPQPCDYCRLGAGFFNRSPKASA